MFWTFKCADIENGISQSFEIYMFVEDEEGNYDFCITSLQIEDNTGNACPDAVISTTVSGTIETETEVPVSKTDVKIASDLSTYPLTMTTDIAGEYEYDMNPTTYNYQVSAERNDNYLNGVTTFDIIKIQRHILGLQELTSPYKLLAADINNSKSIIISVFL